MDNQQNQDANNQPGTSSENQSRKPRITLPDMSLYELHIIPPEIEEFLAQVDHEKRQIRQLQFFKNYFSQHLIKLEKLKAENKEKNKERQEKLERQLEMKKEIIKKFRETHLARLKAFLEMPKIIKDSPTVIAMKKLAMEREQSYEKRKAEFEYLSKLMDEDQPSEELKQKMQELEQLQETLKSEEEELKNLKEEEKHWQDEIDKRNQAQEQTLAAKRAELKAVEDEKAAAQATLDKHEQDYQQAMDEISELENEERRLIEILKANGKQVLIDDVMETESNVSSQSPIILPSTIFPSELPSLTTPNLLKRFRVEESDESPNEKRRRSEAAPADIVSETKKKSPPAFKIPNTPYAAVNAQLKDTPRQAITTDMTSNKENLTSKKVDLITSPVEPILKPSNGSSVRKTFGLQQPSMLCGSSTPPVQITHVHVIPSSAAVKRKSSSPDSMHAPKQQRIENIPVQNRCLDLSVQKQLMRKSTGSSNIGETSKKSQEYRRSADSSVDKILSKSVSQSKPSEIVLKKIESKPQLIKPEIKSLFKKPNLDFVKQQLDLSQNSQTSSIGVKSAEQQKTSSLPWQEQKANVNQRNSDEIIIGSSEPSDEMEQTVFEKVPGIMNRRVLSAAEAAKSSVASPANLKDSGKKITAAAAPAENFDSTLCDDEQQQILDTSSVEVQDFEGLNVSRMSNKTDGTLNTTGIYPHDNSDADVSFSDSMNNFNFDLSGNDESTVRDDIGGGWFSGKGDSDSSNFFQ